MAFEPYSGHFNYRTIGILATQAVVKGEMCHIDLTTGYLEPGTTLSYYGVTAVTATGSATSGAVTTQVIPLQDGQIWICDCTGTPTQTEVGTVVSLTDNSTLDEDDTGNNPFWEIVQVYDAAAKKVLATPMMKNFTSIGS